MAVKKTGGMRFDKKGQRNVQEPDSVLSTTEGSLYASFKGGRFEFQRQVDKTKLGQFSVML